MINVDEEWGSPDRVGECCSVLMDRKPVRCWSLERPDHRPQAAATASRLSPRSDRDQPFRRRSSFLGRWQYVVLHWRWRPGFSIAHGIYRATQLSRTVRQAIVAAANRRGAASPCAAGWRFDPIQAQPCTTRHGQRMASRSTWRGLQAIERAGTKGIRRSLLDCLRAIGQSRRSGSKKPSRCWSRL